MASPLHSPKRSVDLSAPAVRGSRIRRDPPPQSPEKVSEIDPEDRDARIVVIGVVTFALAIAVLVIGVSSYLVGGSSPAEHTIRLEL